METLDLPRITRLSPREVQVLTLRSRGYQESRIAARLGIAESTVKTHMTRIMLKLGVHTAAGAVAEAYRRGLLK